MRKDPPSPGELAQIAKLLPGGAKDLISTRSRRFRDLKPDLDAMDEDAVIQLAAQEPMMLRRPIITDGQRAIVGFDAEAWMELVDASR